MMEKYVGWGHTGTVILFLEFTTGAQNSDINHFRLLYHTTDESPRAILRIFC